jgi:hypothetical protein
MKRRSIPATIPTTIAKGEFGGPEDASIVFGVGELVL